MLAANILIYAALVFAAFLLVWLAVELVKDYRSFSRAYDRKAWRRRVAAAEARDALRPADRYPMISEREWGSLTDRLDQQAAEIRQGLQRRQTTLADKYRENEK